MMDAEPAKPVVEKPGLSDLWRKDDWLAAWLGFIVLGVLIAGAAVTLPDWKWASGSDLSARLSWANLRLAIPVVLGLAAIGFAASVLLRRKPLQFLAGFPVVALLALVAFAIAGNKTLSSYGLEFVFWALALGLAISNTVGTPAWLKAAANTELYVKIGLVLLGAEMLLQTMLKAGALGMVQALLVIVAVWYVCYWLARRLGLDKEFGAILATGVSVCGVSAAIAAGGALKGDPKKVSHYPDAHPGAAACRGSAAQSGRGRGVAGGHHRHDRSRRGGRSDCGQEGDGSGGDREDGSERPHRRGGVPPGPLVLPLEAPGRGAA
jgi:hypothetical protein